MSRSRLAVSLTALAALLGGSIAVAAIAFPLGAQEEPRTAGPQRALLGALRQEQQEAEEEAPVFVRGDVQRPVKIHEVLPQYTEEARLARIQGTVILQAVIGKGGDVERVEVLKGLPIGLSEAAVEAVKQWRFEPATLHGKPVKVYFNLTINFRLGDKKKDKEEGPAEQDR